MDISNLKTWQFCINNDNFIELVLSNEKRDNIFIYKEDDELPKLNECKVLVFDNEKKACITKTLSIEVTELKNICEKLSDDEINYFTENKTSKVVVETFEVIEDLRKTRLEIANKIVNDNSVIFGNFQHKIYEINAGFNNDLFSVDDEYVIKVCANKDKEKQFEVEANFYLENKECNYIPKLYKYDNSKKIVDYVYEIIEKIEGKSLYYYWYKMNENERESTVKNLITILKDIHKVKVSSYDWCSYIKERVLDYYEKTKKYFKNEEQKLIEEVTDLFDIYLKENKFALIHNDLHFDNVIVSNDKLYLIDFNDSMVAPIDYDLRLLFMCKDTPWKWANTEMDPFQLPKDYKNIIAYIKKYYEELNDIEFLDKRITIYNLVNDIRLLSRFNNDELKQNIMKYVRELMLQ